jgi:uncharacterized protein DUF5658
MATIVSSSVHRQKPSCDLAALPLAGLLAFAILSIGDLAFTWLLLNEVHSSVCVAFESNPLAAACLEQYGWHGLFFYKIAAMTLFAITALFIATYQPRKARVITHLGCLTVSGVLLYSWCLLRWEMLP